MKHLIWVVALVACGEERPPMAPGRADAGMRDGGALDAGTFDAGAAMDAGADAGTDAGMVRDAGTEDAGPVPDAGEPSWTEIAGPMTARARHGAVRLADGRVLVVGGTDGTSSLSSADLFDPTTGSWSAAGVMASAHEQPTVTLLADGRVLVAGGVSGTAGTASVELYTPVAGSGGSWAPAMPMPQRRSKHAAVRLADGRVLVCGGDAGGRTGPLASCIAYDPTANTWTLAGMMAMRRLDHTATLLPDGMRVLLAGGRSTVGGARLRTTDIWSSGLVAPGPMLETARATHRAATLSDGRVLVVGGWDSGTIAPTGGEEVYDPVGNVWTTTARFAERFDGHALITRAGGSVVAIGGWAALGFRTDVEVHTATMPLAAGPALPAARAFHSLTELEDGGLLVVGGYDSPWFVTGSAYLGRW